MRFDMKQVISDIDDVIKMLMEHKLEVPAIVWTSVAPTMRKKDVATRSVENPFSVVRKICKRAVTLNPVYVKAVNEQRKQEGNTEEFVGSKHRWATTVCNTFKVKGDQLYLSMIINKELLGPFYFGISAPNNNAFMLDNALVEQFIPKNDTAHYQGLETAVKYTSMILDNVVFIETDFFIYEKDGFDKSLFPI